MSNLFLYLSLPLTLPLTLYLRLALYSILIPGWQRAYDFGVCWKTGREE